MVRRVDLSRGPEFLSCLVYGASRTGKTHFGGTWPRPIFLSDAVEQGYTTLSAMDPSQRYYPDEEFLPPFAIATLDDLWDSVKEIEQMVRAGGPDAPETVVVDSLTFLCVMLENHYRTNFPEAVEKDGYFLWKSLAKVLGTLRSRLQRLPVHVVWIALEKAEEKEQAPDILGSMRRQWAASCSLAMRMVADEIRVKDKATGKVKKKPRRHLRTQPHGGWPAGTRFGALIPDPLKPSYRAIEAALYGEPEDVKPAEPTKKRRTA